MKHIRLLALLFLTGCFLTGCNPIELDDDGGKKDEGGTTTTPEVITEDAISIDSLLQTTAKGQMVFVEGRVVGYVNGTRMATSSLRLEDVDANCTNLILASNTNETNIARMIPVQLSQKYRSNYKLGTLLVVLGTYTSYFGKSGIKNCDIEIVEETPSITPGDTTTTTPPVAPSRTEIHYDKNAHCFGDAR